MKYRKKPVIIEAFKTSSTGIGMFDEFSIWAEKVGFYDFTYKNESIIIHTLEGDMTVSPGDFIIRGVHGEFYPCKPDIFIETYELAEE
jgi:hypothetical protein